MAIQFTVEDGSGLSNANSYVTVAEADQYLENTGRKNSTTWGSKGTADKQAALTQAFFYMKARWQDRWMGIARYENQSGDWPRYSAYKRSGFLYEANEIPTEVKQAQIEYALVAVDTSLFPNPAYDDTNRPVLEKTEKVDVLMESTRYADGSKPQTWRKYPLADNLISFLLGGGSELLRA
jgi:hypothetical protein